MSFSMTKSQVLAGTKTVTRRDGWEDLEPGDHFMAIEKGQGIPKGGKVVRMRELICVGNRREPLQRMLDDEAYGRIECEREGFPGLSPAEFVKFFCKGHAGVTPATLLSRIQFDYV